jgi:hypothetical protein
VSRRRHLDTLAGLSLDGRRIAMATTGGNGTAKGIYTMNVDGTDLRRVTRVIPTTFAVGGTDLVDGTPVRPAWAPVRARSPRSHRAAVGRGESASLVGQ